MNDAGVVLVPLPNRECRRLHMPRNRLRIALSLRHTSTTILVYTRCNGKCSRDCRNRGVRAAPTLRCSVPLMAALSASLSNQPTSRFPRILACAPRGLIISRPSAVCHNAQTRSERRRNQLLCMTGWMCSAARAEMHCKVLASEC